MLRLDEAQQLFEALQDPLLRPALQAFFDEQCDIVTKSLLRAVLQGNRDTLREARLAGEAEAYANIMAELGEFAKRELKQATQ